MGQIYVFIPHRDPLQHENLIKALTHLFSFAFSLPLLRRARLLPKPGKGATNPIKTDPQVYRGMPQSVTQAISIWSTCSLLIFHLFPDRALSRSLLSGQFPRWQIWAITSSSLAADRPTSHAQCGTVTNMAMREGSALQSLLFKNFLGYVFWPLAKLTRKPTLYQNVDMAICFWVITQNCSILIVVPDLLLLPQAGLLY